MLTRWPASCLRRSSFGVAVLVAFLLVGTKAGSKNGAVIRLRSDYRIHTDKILISGHSSGASFVHMFHIIHSELLYGVGIFAGLHYYLYGPTRSMTKKFDRIELEKSINDSAAAITTFSRKGLIDQPRNIANSRIFIWAGTADEMHSIDDRVGAIVTIYDPYLRSPQKLYTKVQYAIHRFPSGHCPPALEKDGYLGNCHYDGFRDMLKHIFQRRIEVSNGPFHKIQEFDQTEFFKGLPGELSLRDTGLLYVPERCRPSSRRSRDDRKWKCHVIFHFHGCSDTTYDAERIFEDMGLDKAEGNDLIIVFPRTKATKGNSIGCWDYTGYTGPKYATKNGVQVRFARRMIKRMTGR